MKKQVTIKESKELTWLKNRMFFLSIRAIEKDLLLPEGTLKKFVDGRRGLAEEWQPRVIDWVKNFKK